MLVVAALMAGLAVPDDQLCVRATKPIKASSIPLASDFVPSPCEPGAVTRAFHYDQRRAAVRSIRDIQPHETLRRLPAALFASIVPGQSFLITTRVGSVQVERQVWALQSARPGQRLFVRAQDGAVFPVVYPGPQP